MVKVINCFNVIGTLSLSVEEIDAIIQMKILQEGQNYICTDCQYVTSIKQVLKKHIEAQHISPGVMCEICHKISPTRHALRMHLKRVHNTLPTDTSY